MPVRTQLALGLLGLLLVSGCKTEPSQPTTAWPDATLRDLKSTRPATATNDNGTDASSNAAPPAPTPPPRTDRLIVSRLIYHRHEPRLRIALEPLQPAPIEPGVLAVWHRNGFRISRVDRSKAMLLLANMPKALGGDSFAFRRGEQFEPLTLVGQVKGGLDVRYTDGSGDAEVVRMTGGRYQMLIRLGGQSPTAAVATVLPHRHEPKPSLLPRPPQEKMLDGQSFTAMRFEEALEEDRLWIVWGDMPDLASEDDTPPIDFSALPKTPPDEPKARPDTDRKAEKADQRDFGQRLMDFLTGGGSSKDAKDSPNKPATDEAQPEPFVDPPPTPRPVRKAGEPMSLAEAMLTGRRGEKPVQIVLIFEYAP